MAFLTGVILLDAPASALNNAGVDRSNDNENAIAVKAVRSKEGLFPYASAQAVRYWLRSTLEREKPFGWQTAPIEREGKIAYTDGNPIRYWDDDLFGYMRAPGKSKDAKASVQNNTLTPIEGGKTLTRVSPLRVSTFMSVAPIPGMTQDFGTMSRHPGNPVPHEHQFYRAYLKGLFSLDLHAAGTFSYIERTGFLHLDGIRIEEAKRVGLQHLESEKSYRLPDDERRNRVAALLEGLSIMSGGAKQTLHYTDVTPAVVLTMVTKGGNNPLQYIIGAGRDGRPVVNAGALSQMIEAWADQIESPLYVGWVEGFCDEQREYLANLLGGKAEGVNNLPNLPYGYQMGHPRLVLKEVVKAFQDSSNNWLG
jgi:CRISPR-associated protein Cst2